MASAATPDEEPTKRSNDEVLNDSEQATAGCSSTQSKRLKTHGSEENIPFMFSDKLTLKELNERLQQFHKERDWGQFHAPRNVLLDLVAEVGELSEIFQWKGEVEEGLPGWSDEARKHVGQELSDVLLCVLNMAHRCRIDLPQAALDKLAHNAQKYPVNKAYGNCKKYTEFE